jgi:glutathione S-transferase
MTNAPENRATTTGARPTVRDAALAAAERFLASTAEAVHPDTPAPALLHYAARYRAHLAAVLAASRDTDGTQ